MFNEALKENEDYTDMYNELSHSYEADGTDAEGNVLSLDVQLALMGLT